MHPLLMVGLGAVVGSAGVLRASRPKRMLGQLPPIGVGANPLPFQLPSLSWFRPRAPGRETVRRVPTTPTVVVNTNTTPLSPLTLNDTRAAAVYLRAIAQAANRIVQITGSPFGKRTSDNTPYQIIPTIRSNWNSFTQSRVGKYVPLNTQLGNMIRGISDSAYSSDPYAAIGNAPLTNFNDLANAAMQLVAQVNALVPSFGNLG